MKIKYPPSAIKKADNEIKALLQNIIDTKVGGTTRGGVKGAPRVLRKITGRLRTRIKPIIKVVDNELFIDVEVMEYYKWLDVGTKKIKTPWFLTAELTSDAIFLKSIEKLTAKGIAFTIEQDLKIT